MARRKDSNSADTQKSIVAAARRLLERDGPNGVTFRSVAKESGLSAGTISYYFPDRLSLLDSCLHQHIERRKRLMTELLRRLEREGSHAGIIADIADASVQMIFEQRKFVRLQTLTNAELRAQYPMRPTSQRLPLLERVGKHLSEDGPLEEHEVRLVLQTMNFALGRYGALSDEELCTLCGCTDVALARERVRLHIRRCATTLLGPGMAAEPDGSRGG